MLAVEVEGGSWVGGRHVRAKGFAADCEKYNAAVLLGWRILRFSPAMIEAVVALHAIKDAFRLPLYELQKA
jgi:hypothetical protein